MIKFRIAGILICLSCLVLGGLFIWGLTAGEPWRFWTIAAPVIVGFIIILGIGFSIGRLMASTEVDEKPKPQSEERSAPTPASEPH